MAHSSLQRTFERAAAWVIASIHVGIGKLIHDSPAIRHHSKIFHHVPHCWPRHTKPWWWCPADFTGEWWMETATDVLCDLKLIFGAYCVGTRWCLAHLLHQPHLRPSNSAQLRCITMQPFILIQPFNFQEIFFLLILRKTAKHVDLRKYKLLVCSMPLHFFPCQTLLSLHYSSDQHLTHIPCMAHWPWKWQLHISQYKTNIFKSKCLVHIF